MNKPLFTNIETITAHSEELKAFLLDGQNLIRWVPEIKLIEKKGNQFYIKRAGPALIKEESISIKEIDGKILYQSTGGRFEYSLEFEFVKEGGKEKIFQTISIPEKLDAMLPVSLLKPVVKKAYGNNLTNLVSIVNDLYKRD